MSLGIVGQVNSGAIVFQSLGYAFMLTAAPLNLSLDQQILSLR